MIAGVALSSAPNAPVKVANTLYQANILVRSTPLTVSESSACSIGRNTLTSPAEGFSVPTTATMNSGQKEWATANPIPVANISTAAALSKRSGCSPCGTSPTASVKAADPNKVPVTIAPTAIAEKPMPCR